jgi:hypothetical protein
MYGNETHASKMKKIESKCIGNICLLLMAKNPLKNLEKIST